MAMPCTYSTIRPPASARVSARVQGLLHERPVHPPEHRDRSHDAHHHGHRPAAGRRTARPITPATGSAVPPIEVHQAVMGEHGDLFVVRAEHGAEMSPVPRAVTAPTGSCCTCRSARIRPSPTAWNVFAQARWLATNHSVYWTTTLATITVLATVAVREVRESPRRTASTHQATTATGTPITTEAAIRTRTARTTGRRRSPNAYQRVPQRSAVEALRGRPVGSGRVRVAVGSAEAEVYVTFTVP